jgi:hypothetical protein
MPTINYTPEKLTHERATPFPKVAPFVAGELFLGNPGIQVVDAITWEKTLKSPEFGDRIQMYLDRGVLTIEDESEKPSLSSRNPTQAIALVKETYDKKLLEAWQRDEARPTVIKVLEAQITTLTPPPVDKKAS